MHTQVQDAIGRQRRKQFVDRGAGQDPGQVGAERIPGKEVAFELHQVAKIPEIHPRIDEAVTGEEYVVLATEDHQRQQTNRRQIPDCRGPGFRSSGDRTRACIVSDHSASVGEAIADNSNTPKPAIVVESALC